MTHPSTPPFSTDLPSHLTPTSERPLTPLYMVSPAAPREEFPAPGLEQHDQRQPAELGTYPPMGSAGHFVPPTTPVAQLDAPPTPGSYGMVSPMNPPGYGPGGFIRPVPGYGFYSSPPLGSPYGMNMPIVSSPYPGSPTVPNPPGRTVYMGDVPPSATVDELLDLVKVGPIENVRLLPEKACAFISFLDPATALSFHADACVKRLALHGTELKVGWGKASPVPPAVAHAAQQSKATRNVYLGNIEGWTEEALREELSRFGLIDQVKIVPDRKIAFVHFLSISTAMKVVASLPLERAWRDKRVNYGKDRCSYIPKSQQQTQAHNHQAAAMGYAAAASLAGYLGSLGTLSSGGARDGDASALVTAASAAAALSQMGNRTVYLGNIHSETTTEEICNHVRGGLLQTIRHLPEKHIAFVTFIDPHAALAFFHMASYSGIMIHNRRLKLGWGKNPGPLSPAIHMAVQAGGSRNVYVGNITNPALHTEAKLRRDFGDFGDIEQVNFLREKHCAFVNFCNIREAIKAIAAMKSHPDYETIKISFGKDRCGNPPRSVLQHVQAQLTVPTVPHGAPPHVRSAGPPAGPTGSVVLAETRGVLGASAGPAADADAA